MKPKKLKQKVNRGVTDAEVKQKLNAALERLGEPKWQNGRLVRNETKR